MRREGDLVIACASRHAADCAARRANPKMTVRKLICRILRARLTMTRRHRGPANHGYATLQIKPCPSMVRHRCQTVGKTSLISTDIADGGNL